MSVNKDRPKAIVSLQNLPRRLGVIAIVLVLLSSLGQIIKYTIGNDHLLGFTPLFSLNGELNFPSYFSAGLHAFSAMLLLIVFSLKRNTIDGIYWLVLAVGFFYLSIDEAFSFHEGLSAPVQKLFGHARLSGFYLMAWALPGVLIAGIVGLSYLKFLMRLAPATRNAFLISAAIFLGGALGMEMIGSWYMEAYGYENPVYPTMWTIEESMEMGGIIYFIRSLLQYLRAEYESLTLFL